ncbi:ABC transporter ATP-binding protein [Candidatus Peregrinibacteria bacterium]|nr:ABC transporter ATP-binding protein [Candidatus Peregrinibacteria bacterium]
MSTDEYGYQRLLGAIDASVDEGDDDRQMVNPDGTPGPEEMQVRDHVMTLRYAIHEQINGVIDTRPDSLVNLLPHELYTSYQGILRNFKEADYVKINEGELELEIENWVKALTDYVRENKISGSPDLDEEALQAQCWMLFDSMADVVNGVKLSRDVKENKDKAQCLKLLQEKYEVSRVEAEILFDVVRKEKGAEEYSMEVLIETVARLWKQYDLGKQKGRIAKLSVLSLIGQAARSYAPSLFEGIMDQGTFKVEAFLAYTGLNVAADGVNTRKFVDMEAVKYELNKKINARIVDSIFFREFEFIHEKSLGELYIALERGKTAARELISDVLAEFLPLLTGLIMSLMFLTKINPVLGSAGFAAIPFMYRSAKRHNQELHGIYDSEMDSDEQIANALGDVKQGMEEVLVSADTAVVAAKTRELLDKRDELAKQRGEKQWKAIFLQYMPFEVAAVFTGVAGSILQSLGKMTGGQVLASTFYTTRLFEPIRYMVKLYFSRFSRYLQDIKKMEKTLGNYDELDLPDGEREKNRVSVDSLNGREIEVNNLGFKGILNGVNLRIPEGQFLTIAGPSGAGKSTLLRVLAGLYKPDSGSVKIGGRDVADVKKHGPESIYSIISYCNQSPQIFENMTLRENLLLWSGVEKSDAEIRKVLQDLHLGKFVNNLDDRIKHFSGGERVRIGVARTLLKGAKIMLLDEPTASLDSSASTEVRKAIMDIHQSYPDVTIVCVTHDQNVIDMSDSNVELAAA